MSPIGTERWQWTSFVRCEIVQYGYNFHGYWDDTCYDITPLLIEQGKQPVKANLSPHSVQAASDRRSGRIKAFTDIGV